MSGAFVRLQSAYSGLLSSPSYSHSLSLYLLLCTDVSLMSIANLYRLSVFFSFSRVFIESSHFQCALNWFSLCRKGQIVTLRDLMHTHTRADHSAYVFHFRHEQRWFDAARNDGEQTVAEPDRADTTHLTAHSAQHYGPAKNIELY